jgi:GMP reductase
LNVPSKVVKSFAFGADFAMIGGNLGYALEAENNGEMSGMASLKNHQDNNKEIKSIEGRTQQIDNNSKRPLKEIVDEYLWGIRSACTYLNCKSYKELQYKCRIVEVNEKI